MSGDEAKMDEVILGKKRMFVSDMVKAHRGYSNFFQFCFCEFHLIKLVKKKKSLNKQHMFKFRLHKKKKIIDVLT